MTSTNEHSEQALNQVVSDRILTIPNILSFIRLCMVPVFFIVYCKHYTVIAALIFAVAAGTDFIDGYIARRTNCVTKLGQLLDPTVDRLLMITGALALIIVGFIPVWVFVIVVARDLIMLLGGAFALRSYGVRVDVVFAGKLATTFLYVGFAFVLLHAPMVDGLGVCTYPWLPGFNALPAPLGIWFVYIGIVLAISTTIHYAVLTCIKVKAVIRARQEA